VPQRTPRAILREIERLGDETPPDAYEELARQGSAAALRALVAGIEFLDSGPAFAKAYAALRHFVGGPQERAARAYLAERLEDPELFARWCAVEPLLAFGADGVEILWRTGLETRDEHLRKRIGAALLPAARERGDGNALRFLLHAYDVEPKDAAEKLVAALADFRGPRLARALSAGLEEEDVPSALAQAVVTGLARVPGEDLTTALVGLLRSEDPALLAATIEALRRRGDAQAVPGLERVARGDDPARFAALAALLELAPEPARAPWAEALRGGLVRTDPGERILAVDALQSLRSSASIEILIAALGAEEDPAVRAEIAAALRALTGLDLGTQQGPWSRWWEGARTSFVVPELDAAREAERARRRAAWLRNERYDFYGLAVESQRVCFVLDVSGSMMAEDEIGLSRLDVAKRQLSGCLRRLPDGALFDVVFFGTTVEVLAEEPLLMSAEVRQRALARVQRQRTLGLTAVHDALERAFALQGIDAIYLLSDGTPSAGGLTDPGQIRAAVRAWNAVRKPRITLHCVSVGGRQELLAGLAEDSGGRYVEAEAAADR
jgi:HEAT repeat protein